MFYQSGSVWRMWDIWCYSHDDITYQYALCMEHEAKDDHWDCIALATSSDCVHWTDRGVIHRKSANADRMGTGSVWLVSDGCFVMSYSELYQGYQRQRFLVSYDLVNWTPAGADTDFFSDERWYLPKNWGRINMLPKENGGFYAYLTARTKHISQFPDALDFYSVGMAETVDGLHFGAIHPPRIEWGDVPPSEYTEVCDVRQIGSQYYLVGGMSGYNGDIWGCYSFVGDSPVGPFHPDAQAYRLLGADETAQRNSYFLNFFQRENELLAVHFSVCLPREAHPMFFHRHVFMAPVKKLVVDPAGHLRLAYWAGNEACKGAALLTCETAIDFSAIAGGYRINMLSLDASTGIVLECTCQPHCQPVGFFFEDSGHDGMACFLEPDGCLTIGRLEHEYNFGNWRGRRLLDTRDCINHFPWSADGEKHLLVMARCGLVEIYIDGWLGQTFSLPHEWTGRIGIAAFSPAQISDIHAWQMNL